MEPLGPEQRANDLAAKRTVLSNHMATLESLKQDPNVTQEQRTKIDEAIVKVQEKESKIQTSLAKAKQAALQKRINDVLKSIAEMSDDPDV
jgi:hypothetical protein